MASYIDNNLTKSEKVLYRATTSWWSQLFLIILGVLLIPVGIGIVFIIIAIIRVHTTELALTNKRVIAKTGFIQRQTVELRADKIESIIVDQGVFGRIFNFGNVVVKGTGGVGTPIPFINEPLSFRKMVNEFIDEPEQFDD